MMIWPARWPSEDWATHDDLVIPLDMMRDRLSEPDGVLSKHPYHPVCSSVESDRLISRHILLR